LGVGGVERHVCSLSANLNHEEFESWLIAGRLEKSEREGVQFAAETGRPISPERSVAIRRQYSTARLN